MFWKGKQSQRRASTSSYTSNETVCLRLKPTKVERSWCQEFTQEDTLQLSICTPLITRSGCNRSHSSDETLQHIPSANNTMLSSASHIALNPQKNKTPTNKTWENSLVVCTEASVISVFGGPPRIGGAQSCFPWWASQPWHTPNTHRQVQKRSTFDLSAECLAMIISSSLPLIHLLLQFRFHLF